MTTVVMATAMVAMGLEVDQVNLPDTQDTAVLKFQSLHPFLGTNKHSGKIIHPVCAAGVASSGDRGTEAILGSEVGVDSV